MIGAGISYYGQQGVNYALGNAKVYDGSFDYDVVNNSINRNFNEPFSIFCDCIPQIGGDAQFIANNFESVGGGFIRGWSFVLVADGSKFKVAAQIRSDSNIAIFSALVFTAANFDYNQRYVIVANYNGNGLASGFEITVNGVLQTNTVIFNNLLNRNTQSSANFTIGKFTTSSAFYLKGRLKQLEILNRVATSGEIAAASATGSFQGAGIALADYLLSVDFDKTGTVNATTRTGTPSYTITAIGGASYTQYLPV